VPAAKPESVNVAAVWLVLAATNGPLALTPRDTVYPVAPDTASHDTVIWPLVLSAFAATLAGTTGGMQTGVAETSIELGEAQVPLLAVTT
jgi:hypothetical protein